MWPRRAADHRRRERPGERDRRAQVDLEHPVDLLLGQLGEPPAGRAAPAFATRTSTSPRRARRAADRPRCDRRGRTAIARAPSSPASGSSTSARRPVSTRLAPRGGECPRDRVADARPWRRSRARCRGRCSRRRQCSRARRGRGPALLGNSATVAVKPCRKLAPADRADLAGGEEAGRRALRRARAATIAASWSPGPNMALPRPLQEKHERARRRVARIAATRRAERPAEVLVGRAGVARVQPDHLSRVARRADARSAASRGRRRARRGRGSRPARTRAGRCRSRSRSAVRRRSASARAGRARR